MHESGPVPLKHPMRAVMHESGTVLLKKTPALTPLKHQECAENVETWFRNPNLSDDVKRVGCEPLWKLGQGDYLLPSVHGTRSCRSERRNMHKRVRWECQPMPTTMETALHSMRHPDPSQPVRTRRLNSSTCRAYLMLQYGVGHRLGRAVPCSFTVGAKVDNDVQSCGTPSLDRWRTCHGRDVMHRGPCRSFAS